VKESHSNLRLASEERSAISLISVRLRECGFMQPSISEVFAGGEHQGEYLDEPLDELRDELWR